MGFAKEDTRKLQETDLTTFTRTCRGAKLIFTGTGCSDIETEEHDLEKLGKHNGGKLVLFNLKAQPFYRIY